ncbi:N-acetyltransferase [candidate division KSB1 bacterium]|nr:N-acetyltransferase [candidate division KSB1 bacterium]RQW06522.1 MAG: N-acetyltransferase [candidate division KSB1 bacterium]
MIDIRPVSLKKELRQFITLPWKIYKDDPYWVPPLIADQYKLFDKKNGTFFSFGQAELFMAFDGKEPLGRITAHIDFQYEKYRDDRSGRFGFFECVNDQYVADLLFDRAEEWVRAKGKKRIEGPYNFTLYDASGVLYEGFDSMPVVLLTYNPQYYNDLLVNGGFEKAIDWYAFMVRDTVELRPSFKRIRERVLQQGIRIERLDMKKLDAAVQYIGPIFNEGWMDNWGHVPFTDGQLRDLRQELKYVVEPNLTYLAFLQDECIGFSLSAKDANPALKKANGRLFPFGLLRIMLEMRKIKRLRTIAMGVLKEHRHRGLDTLFYLNTIEEGIQMGYRESECSMIVETNQSMIAALERLDAERYKTYRFYQKEL